MITIIILSPIILAMLGGSAFALHHARRLLDQRQGRVIDAARAWRRRPSIATDRALCEAVDRYFENSG